jgi:hypothetical protein
MAKRTGNRAIFTSLTIRKGCRKEVMHAYSVYFLQKTIFYMRICRGEPQQLDALMAQISTLRSMLDYS